jgi:hypothetical protein
VKSQVQQKAKIFQKLKFTEKTHQYKVSGKKLPSVSSLIGKYKNKFNAKEVSKGTARKLKKTQEEVLKDWKDINTNAIRLGNKVHKFAEDYVQGKQPVIENIQQRAVIRFWEELPDYYIPVFFELKMYHLDYLFAGTSDFLLLDTRDNSLVVGDYKTNKDIFKNYRDQKMKAPFEHLYDMPYNHYQIQLGFYQLLTEQLGFKVSDRLLVWIKRDGSYKTYNPYDFTDILKQELENEN